MVERCEKFSLNFSISLLVIMSIFAIFNHPHSLMVYLLGVFSFFFKVLFSGFLQFEGYFVDGQNNSKYRDCAPLNNALQHIFMTNHKVFQANIKEMWDY